MVMSRDRLSRPRGRTGNRLSDGQELVENTLKEIRKRHSSTYRLSSEEIDRLLGDIRRSRSASEGRGCANRPPPPVSTPPPLPDEVLPFGRSQSACRKNKKETSPVSGLHTATTPTVSTGSVFGSGDTCHESGGRDLNADERLLRVKLDSPPQQQPHESKRSRNECRIKQSKQSGDGSTAGRRKLGGLVDVTEKNANTVIIQHDEKTPHKDDLQEKLKANAESRSEQPKRPPRRRCKPIEKRAEIVDDTIKVEIECADKDKDSKNGTDAELSRETWSDNKTNKNFVSKGSNEMPKISTAVDPALNMVLNLRQRLEAMTDELEKVQAAADRISCRINDEDPDNEQNDDNLEREDTSRHNDKDNDYTNIPVEISNGCNAVDTSEHNSPQVTQPDDDNDDYEDDEWEVEEMSSPVDESSNDFNINIEVDPDTERLADERKEEGNQLYKQKNYRDALHKYSEAIDLCPQSASFYGNRSACYLMLGQPRQALEDSKTATSLDSSFVKGWSRLAKCSIMLGDTVTARQAMARAGTEDQTDKKNLDLLERFKEETTNSINSKDYRRALYCLDKCLEIATHSLPLKTLRAECLAFLGRYPEAQEAANGVLTLDNMNADAIYVRGLCLYYEDNVDRAFSHFQQVLRFAPDHSKAKEAYKKAKQLKQKKEEGNTAFKSGQLDSALNLYSEALEIDPFNRSTNSKLYFNRATVQAKLGKIEQSIQDCNKAIDLDANYIKAYLRRAKSYMDTEQYDEAVRDYEHVFKSDKSNREYRQLLQNAKLELRKSKRKDYYKILGIDKNANEEEIKKAYRKRAMVHHPDRHSGATEQEKKDHETKFKEVGEAYAILSDEKKRRAYDSGQDLDDMGGGHGFHDIDPNTIFQAFFGGGGGMGGMGGMGGGGHGGQHFSFGPGGGQSFSFQFG